MTFSRRQFLQGLSASTVTAANMSLLSGLASMPAMAQQSSGDFKALVCVFLYGGMDNHDFVLPYDQSSYDEFATVRQSLLSRHGNNRLRENLLPLSVRNSTDSRQFALPPEMPQLQALFNQGNMALVANVGPLIEPIADRDQVVQESVLLPARLYSHNDQQATWQANATEGAQNGWGGLFTDYALSLGGGSAREFSSITTDGNNLFLTGFDTQPYQVALGEEAGVIYLNDPDATGPELNELLNRHFASTNFTTEGLIQRDVANLMAKSFSDNQLFNQANDTATNFEALFPSGPLGQQLRKVAETLSIRDQLSVNRQVYFVGLGGFDTHSAQASDLPALQQQLDGALAAFAQAVQNLGLDQNVTLFTASDFGRTLTVNGDGTDHGWGAHHLVLGGAVDGGKIFGQMPPSGLGHNFDAGNGRLVPTTSVEQYAAGLGSWFGLNDAQLAEVFPNLGNFSDGRLPLLS